VFGGPCLAPRADSMGRGNLRKGDRSDRRIRRNATKVHGKHRTYVTMVPGPHSSTRSAYHATDASALAAGGYTRQAPPPELSAATTRLPSPRVTTEENAGNRVWTVSTRRGTRFERGQHHFTQRRDLPGTGTRTREARTRFSSCFRTCGAAGRSPGFGRTRAQGRRQAQVHPFSFAQGDCPRRRPSRDRLGAG